jgi:hypothetical protein
MSESLVRGMIKTVVEGVANVGIVHDYERWANDWSVFLDRYKTTVGATTVIRGWTITCASWSQDHASRAYTFKIRGIFGLDDSAASEKTAIGLVEDVCEALNLSSDWDEGEGAELTVFEPRMFGSVLCHYAEITLRVAMAEVF